MSYGTCLKVWGDLACFTRPEMKAERVSYDVITPSVARNLLQSVYWKPEFDWVIDRIEVLRRGTWMAVKRNELGDSIVKPGRSHVLIDEHQQRSTLLLKDVAYLLHVHVELTRPGANGDDVGKHLAIFQRRVEKGQCFQRPYLGCREFEAHFDFPAPGERSPLNGTEDLGYMLLDIEFDQDAATKVVHKTRSRFFRARMVDGVLEVPHPKYHRLTP
jgi:CRISPR-associated protein Cas5d